MEKGLFSIIVPVYNRPDEVAELLASLREQTDKGFEIILVEDGSSVPCRQQAEAAAQAEEKPEKGTAAEAATEQETEQPQEK